MAASSGWRSNAVRLPPRRIGSIEGDPVTSAELYRPCDKARLGFRTTTELPDSPITLGQDRAVSAIQFGIGIRHNGSNLFALGPSNAGEHVIARQFLEQQAALEPSARDCVMREVGRERPPGPPISA